MQRYFAKNKKENEFILDNNDIYHILTVMRMKNNDEIEVVYDEELYICIIKLEDKNIKIISDKKIKKNNSRKKINLILPILKEQKQDLIIQKATELGVNKLIFLETERTIVKIDENKINKKLERWYKIAKEASEQSKRLDIPIIEVKKNFKSLNSTNDLNLVCDTLEKENNLKNSLKTMSNYDTINIVIGPEGGLSKDEIKYLNSIGYKSVTFGEKILRVETVPIYLLSIINYELME